jgi:hypothetical protein
MSDFITISNPVLIPITEITTGIVDGTGHFDQMMKAINAQIDYQYQQGRIKGSDYATVYLGALQYALQLSTQYATANR